MQKQFRKNIRLKNYDYSKTGFYFITICTEDRLPSLSYIEENKIIFTEIGRIVNKFWLNIPNHFPNSELDEYVIMPNHLHGIISIVGVEHVQPLQNRFQHIIPESISTIIRSYKAAVKKYCNENRYTNFSWQRSFYEHIIRNDQSLYNIRNYILNNPENWNYDIENPTLSKMFSEDKLKNIKTNYYTNFISKG